MHVADVCGSGVRDWTARRDLADLGLQVYQRSPHAGQAAYRRDSHCRDVRTGRSPTSRSSWSQTFADQAVIAIENVRLFDEVQAKTRDLTEALTYQTGSSNILSVIASSPTDVGPVLKAIVESACELCDAYDAIIALKDGNELRFSAHHGPIPMTSERMADQPNCARRARLRRPRRRCIFATSFPTKARNFQIGQEMSRRDGLRSILSVPLLREGDSIGTIVLRRIEVHPFSDKQIALAADLRRPGRDRDRQCPAVRGGAGEDARPHGIAGAADRDLRSARRDQQLRSRSWIRCSRRCLKTRFAFAAPNSAR